MNENDIPSVPLNTHHGELSIDDIHALNKTIFAQYYPVINSNSKFIIAKRLDFPKTTDRLEIELNQKNIVRCKNLDAYLEEFLALKIQIVNSITEQEDINLVTSKILKDNNCLWNMGKFSEKYHPEYDMACQGCQLVRKFIKTKIDDSNRKVIIKCGKLARTEPYELKLENTYISNVVSNYVKKDFKAYREMLSNDSLEFLNQEKSATSLISKSYINTILISSLIEAKMTRMNMPHSRIIYLGFICKDNGYILIENNKIMKLEDLNKILESGVNDPRASAMDVYNFFKTPIIRTIINQLLASLHFLSYYSFTFGKYGLNNIGFERKKFEYTYDGVNVNGEYILKYMDLTHSSITIRSIDRSKVTRVTDVDTLDNMYYLNELDLLNLEEVVLSDGKWIKLSNISSMILYEKYRHLGFILSASILDFYAYFISLMSYNKFFDSFINDSNYNWIWFDMWRPEEYEIIKHRIQTPLLTKVDVLAALTNVYMRTDITNRIWLTYKRKMHMSQNTFTIASPSQATN